MGIDRLPGPPGAMSMESFSRPYLAGGVSHRSLAGAARREFFKLNHEFI